MHQNLPSNVPMYVRERIGDAILPVEFSEAVRAISACQSIDEGKYWSDKADALAAWAKIFQKDEAAIAARRLKAHAYRRMAHLADELAEQTRGNRRGRAASRQELLKAGISKSQIKRVRHVGAVPEEKFCELMAHPNAPTIGRIASHGVGLTSKKLASTDAWRTFASPKYGQLNGHVFRQFCRANSALELGRGISPGEVTVAKRFVEELRDWLEEFEASFPKEEG